MIEYLHTHVRGSTSNIIRVHLMDSSVTTGAGLTGLTSGSAGLTISVMANNESSPTNYTQAGSTIEAVTTLGTYSAPTATKCRFSQVDSTHLPGVYEIQLADARYAVASSRYIDVMIKGATNLRPCMIRILLTDANPYDAVRGGMTALPNANAAASGGLIINGSNSGTVTLAALTVSGAVTFSSTWGITGAVTFSNGIIVNKSSANSDAIAITGNGTGSGISCTGGSTGNGMSINSGAGATGAGILIQSTATNGNGVTIQGKGTGHGIQTIGGLTSGIGLYCQGQGTGNGFYALGGNTSGSGFVAQSGSGSTGDGAIFVSGSVAGRGLYAAGTGTSAGIQAIGGSTSGHGLQVTGGGTGDGLNSISGSGATGNGATFTASSTNGNGMSLTKSGTGKDLNATTTNSLEVNTLSMAGSSNAASVLRYLNDGFETGTTQAGGGAATVVLAAGASASNDYYLNAVIVLDTKEERRITAYNGTTKVATVDSNWVTGSPGSGLRYVILGRIL